MEFSLPVEELQVTVHGVQLVVAQEELPDTAVGAHRVGQPQSSGAAHVQSAFSILPAVLDGL